MQTTDEESARGLSPPRAAGEQRCVPGLTAAGAAAAAGVVPRRGAAPSAPPRPGSPLQAIYSAPCCASAGARGAAPPVLSPQRRSYGSTHSSSSHGVAEGRAAVASGSQRSLDSLAVPRDSGAPASFSLRSLGPASQATEATAVPTWKLLKSTSATAGVTSADLSVWVAGAGRENLDSRAPAGRPKHPLSLDEQAKVRTLLCHRGATCSLCMHARRGCAQVVLTKLGFPKMAVGVALQEAAGAAKADPEGSSGILEDSLQILLRVRLLLQHLQPQHLQP
jgi:hypothetical protein